MRDGGASWAEIGRAFGTTRTAARFAFIRLGLPMEPWPRCHLFENNGYVMAALPGGRQEFAHRLAMEAHLGRRLRRGEIVHHIDENKRNNAISNLHLLPSIAAHRQEHGMRAKCHRCAARAVTALYGSLCFACFNHHRRYHLTGACSVRRGGCRFAT